MTKVFIVVNNDTLITRVFSLYENAYTYCSYMRLVGDGKFHIEERMLH